MKMKMLRSALDNLNDIMLREWKYYRVTPGIAMLFLTYRCTSRCRSCTMWQRSVSGTEMTLGEWKNAIDMLQGEYPMRNIEMFGGDALLRKDVIVPLTRYIKEKYPCTEVDTTTNCHLLDRETARGLVDAGMNVIYISMDGLEESHDQIRGVDGSFRKLREAVGYLVEAKKGGEYPHIVLNCTVSAMNVDHFEKLLPFAESLGADKMAFEYVGEFPTESVEGSRIGDVVPEPYYPKQEASLLLNRDQAVLLKQKLKRLKENRRSLRVRLETRNIDTLTIDELTSGKPPNRKCYVCRYQVTVDPFGNVLPCPFFNRYHLGNLRREHIGLIWNGPEHRKFLRRADGAGLPMCAYCILSVERNPTVLQSLRNVYFEHTRKGYDE